MTAMRVPPPSGVGASSPPPTLNNGLPASTVWGALNTQNPPAAPGLYGRNPNYPITRPGYMEMINPYPSTNIRYRLNFLFNPGEIQESYTLNQNYTNPEFQSTSVLGNVAYLLSGVSLGWSLLFDRRLDVATGKSTLGVLEDIGAFENMVAARFGSQASTSQSTGQLTSQPLKVVFGVGKDGTLFEFTGFVSSATTTFTQFNADMIPTLATLDVALTRILYNPTTGTSVPVPYSGQGPAPTGATRTALITKIHSLPPAQLQSNAPQPPPSLTRQHVILPQQ